MGDEVHVHTLSDDFDPDLGFNKAYLYRYPTQDELDDLILRTI